MPKTLTPVNAFPSNIPNFPLAGNNEPVAIGPLENAIQAILNRTENLHQSRLVVEGEGIKRIQRVANLTALQNLAGMNDQDVVSVDGYGLYRLFNPSALTADGLWILTATGGGRWVHLAYLMRGIANGWAMLDSNGRLAQDVRGGSIQTQHLANAAVTAAKLAPDSVVAHLGYTPVNKAGDSMTGTLAVPRLAINFIPERVITAAGDEAIVAKIVKTSINNGSGSKNGVALLVENLYGTHSWGQVAEFRIDQISPGQDPPNIGFTAGWSNTGWNIGFADNGDDDFAIVEKRGFRWNSFGTVRLRLTKDGELRCRYDHENRWVISGALGGFQTSSLGNNSTYVLHQYNINVPSGKNLYLRRARFQILEVRLRVSSSLVWTSSSGGGDLALNVNLTNGNTGLQPLVIELANNTGSTRYIYPQDSFWIELEIR